MTLEAIDVLKCLADATRLSLVLLIHREGELCVCELTHALGLSQPKVSRHLAQLRRVGLLADRRDGQWVYYGLEPGLPGWVTAILTAAAEGDATRLDALAERLECMGDRPGRRAVLC
ncbi:metalloregulator ArsR/SmtB family transcription factor [Halomonas nitroreducens]|uniref:ArsR family transcriptional regulator n=1 Tax=Halomonas nitroreducens TaxID=447425 RepID=A0A431V4J8_9GAMM|nr:metalloregulator ArsR/SmtB family transcription factor [Halomonas nitroreducens]RTR05242.1 ArsR family transcriptional regulator [Halomonas nitroreducens]